MVTKHLYAIAILPGIVTIVIPAGILWTTDSLNLGESLHAPWNLLPYFLGLAIISLGIILMTSCIVLFAHRGDGTLAPWMPTKHLVVYGPYRYVRNPMILGVFSVLFGEAVLAGSLALLYWFLVFMVLNLLYVPLMEERSLIRRFGEEYRRYQRYVRRWIPRISPWESGVS